MKLSSKNFIFGLWIAFILFLFYGSLLPFQYNPESKSLGYVIKTFFAAFPIRTHISKMDILTNLILYVPLGFLTVAVILRTGRNMVVSVLESIFFSGCISLAIEIGQAYFSARTSSIVDVFLNTISGALGAFGAAIFFPLFYKVTFQTWNRLLRNKPILLITLVYAAILYLGALLPFDVSIDIGSLKDAIKETLLLTFQPEKAPPLNYVSMLTDFVLYVGFAALCRISLRLYAKSIRLPGFLALCLTVGFSCFIEFSQLFIVSRFTKIQDIFVAFGAGILGVFLSIPVEKLALQYNAQLSSSFSNPSAPSPSFRLSVVYFKIGAVLGYSFIVTLLLLSPLKFEFTWEMAKSHISPAMFIPLYAYWANTNFGALQDLIFTTLIYVPLGAVLYFSVRRIPFARFLTLLWCFLFSSGIEFLQIFQPGRVAEITDILSAFVGGWLGIVLVKKLTSKSFSVQ